MITTWHTPTIFPILSSSQVHLWQLTVPIKVNVSLMSLLTDTEMQTAKRFKFEQDRRRFFTTKIGLKILLAQYLNIAPQKLKFVTNAYGKPALENQSLQFNLSHTKNNILYAFYTHFPIGVDLEYMRKDLDFEGMANLVFHPTEIKKWSNLDKNQKIDAFFQLWTLKEAYIKAIGQGFSYPVKTLALPDTDCPFSLLTKENNYYWSFYPITVDQAFKAAITLPSQTSVTIHCFTFENIEKWHQATHCAI